MGKLVKWYGRIESAQRDEGGLPCTFLKIDFFHLWVKISIQNAVLRKSAKKNTKISACGAFLCF